MILGTNCKVPGPRASNLTAGQDLPLRPKEPVLAGDCDMGADPTAVPADHPAFEAIVRQHGPHVARLAHRLLGWPADVEDVGQDVFLAVWVHLSGFEDRSHVGRRIADPRVGQGTHRVIR